jgi:hypothetical protein
LRETPHRTPLHSRPYLRAFNAQLTPFSKSAHKMEGEMVDEVEEEQAGTLYGTSINIRRAMISIEQFVMEFEVEGEKIYRSQLIEIQDSEETIYEVDGRHLQAASQELYLQFVYYPV